MRKILSFLTAILFAGSMMAANYELVTAASQLEAGAKYVIGTAAGKFIATTSNANNRKITDATVTDGVVEATDAVMVFTLGGSADAWTFATENYAGAAGYLNATNTTGSNNLKVVADLDDYAYFTIAIADGVTTITCNGKTSRNILYQNGSTCFSCYNEQTSAQYIKPSLYKEVSSTPQTYYTVAGSSDVAFGTAWDPTNKANDMKLQTDGSYKWEKTGLELAAGSVDFKVCKDHVWDVAYPAENYKLAIAESGVYTITITFEPANENKVSAVATKTADLVVLPTVVLHGNFAGEWADTDPFTAAEDKLTAELKLTLAEGTYEFGFKFDGAWKANGATITRENPTTSLAEGNGNMKITADQAGEYVLTYTFATEGLAVTYPKKQAVLPAGAYMLTFKGTGTSSDNSNEFKKDDDIFTDECKAYVASVDTISKVYAARIIDENTSSLKFGTTSVKGYLQFTLATPVEVDSIIVNATQYGKNAAEVTVNGTKFDLTAGNKVPTDCKITPEGKVSAITIAQTGSERIYLRYVTVYPKQGGEPVVENPAKFYITGDSALVVNAGLTVDKAWNPAAIKVTETSYKLNLAAGDYKLKVVVGEGEAAQWKGFDALTTIATGLTGDGDGNICFTLTEAGEVNVHYDGEFFFLNGNFYVAPVEVKYYLKNNWGGEAWTWKEMTALNDGTYMLYNVVVGGEGVNRNTAESDEGASWFAWADIETFDASYVSATIGALDTVVIYFDPEAVNSFTGANGMSAQILGKYVAPVEPEVKLPVVAIAGTMNEWSAEANIMANATDSLSASVTIALEAQKYEFKVVSDGNWLSLNGEGETLYGIHREWNEVAHINGVNLRNFELTADVAGEYTFTWTYADSTLVVAFPEKPAEPVVDEWAEIKFTAATAAGAFNDTVFTVEGSEFSLKCVDTNDKLKTTANNASFGTVADRHDYQFRLQTGGKSSSKNNMELNIPAAGQLRIAVRTATSSDETRTVVLVQDGDTIYNKLVLDKDTIEGVTNPKIFNFVYVNVKKGTVAVSYPVNGVNFYSFAFKADGSEEPVVEPAKFYITGDSALVVNAGLTVDKAWNPAAIKSTETSYKLNLAAGDYKLKVVVGEGEAAQWKGFDALTTIATGLTADESGNICFTLTEAGEVNVHYDGEFFFLNGNFYVAPVEVKYYLKNNWGGEAWTWKEMTALDDGTYMLYNVVVGGEGVNRNTAESDEGASWFAWADIETFDASYAPATIGALDTVVIYFDPEAVNSFTGANGMSAQILGKYVAPVDPQPAEHTYTVAGNLTAAFGTAWDPAYAANDMVKQEDGTYKWEKAELVLPAGTIEFKVVVDHAWGEEYPANNYQLAIAEAGKYTLTITFNPETKAVAANAEKTGSAEVDPTVSAKGSWDEWANELVFTLAADKATASLTVNNVKAGTYEFKVILNGGEWRSNGYKFTREAASVEGITGNDNANMKLVADVDGTYTFTWTFATNALNITFPAAGPTALDNINADGKAVKVLRNGQILIKKGDKTYNVMGAIVR